MVYKYSEPKSVFKRIVNSKVLLLGLLIILVLVGLATYKENKRQQKTVNTLSALEQEVAKLENKNMELSELIQYLKSDDFVDREAREKLNMQQPGEQVVLISREVVKEMGQASSANGTGIRSNWQLWQEYFFGE